MKNIALLFACLMLLFPANAHAYIDPGTGSLILQALAAGGVTALIFLRNLRHKIFSFFSRKKEDK